MSGVRGPMGGRFGGGVVVKGVDGVVGDEIAALQERSVEVSACKPYALCYMKKKARRGKMKRSSQLTSNRTQ